MGKVKYSSCLGIDVGLIFLIFLYSIIKDKNIKGIILVYFISGLIWTIYCKFLAGGLINSIPGRGKYSIDPPKSAKCFIGERKCEEAVINIWTLFHFIINFIAGYFYPNRYLFVFIFAFITEIWELLIGFNAKWFIDPLANLSGYMLGSYLHKNL